MGPRAEVRLVVEVEENPNGAWWKPLLVLVLADAWPSVGGDLRTHFGAFHCAVAPLGNKPQSTTSHAHQMEFPLCGPFALTV